MILATIGFLAKAKEQIGAYLSENKITNVGIKGLIITSIVGGIVVFVFASK